MLAWQISVVVLSLSISAVVFYWMWYRSSRTSRKAMLTLTRHMPDPVLIANREGSIIAYSAAACQLFAYDPSEIMNMSVEKLMPTEFAEKHRQIRKGYMSKNRGQAMDNEVTCLNKNGERIAAVTRVRTFFLEGESYAYVSIHDVREYKNREALLKNLSEQDPLTGLANRRLFDHDMEREWQRAMRNNQPLTLMMIDIDYFKQYNDFYGHPVGDSCLKSVAETIQNTVQRGTDCIARYGGEEFICLLPSLNREGGFAKAELLRESLESKKIEHKQSFISPFLTISVGVVTLIPQEGLEMNLFIEKADAALYQAKADGRNCVRGQIDLERQSNL